MSESPKLELVIVGLMYIIINCIYDSFSVFSVKMMQMGNEQITRFTFKQSNIKIIPLLQKGQNVLYIPNLCSIASSSVHPVTIWEGMALVLKSKMTVPDWFIGFELKQSSSTALDHWKYSFKCLCLAAYSLRAPHCSPLLSSLWKSATEHSLGLWNCIPAVDLFRKATVIFTPADKRWGFSSNPENQISYYMDEMELYVALQCYYNKRKKSDSALFVVSRWLIAASQLRHKSRIRHIWRRHGGRVEDCVSVNNCWI